MKLLTEFQDDVPIGSFQISTPVGSTWDPKGREGLVCHAAELSLRGAGDKARTLFDRELDSLGASLGFVVGRDDCTLHGSALIRNMDAVISAAAQAIARPIMDEAEHQQLLRESLRSIEEVADDDQSLAMRAFNARWPFPPYSRSTLGTTASLSKIDRVHTVDAHKSIFAQSENIILGLCGSWREEQAQQISARLQEAIASQSTPSSAALSAPQIGPTKHTEPRWVFVDKPGRNQCQVVIGVPTPRYGSADFDALSIADCAFGGIFCSRLMQEVRVERGWSYDVGSSLSSGKHDHCMQIHLSPSHEDLGDALRHVHSMIEQLQDGLGESEFSFVRSYLLGSDCFSWATPRQRLRNRIGDLRHGLPAGFAAAYRERIAAISRTEVNQAIERHLKEATLTLVVGTRAAVEPALFDFFAETVDYRSFS